MITEHTPLEEILDYQLSSLHFVKISKRCGETEENDARGTRGKPGGVGAKHEEGVEQVK